MHMNRRFNAASLALVKQWEGLKTRAYRDVADVLTIGAFLFIRTRLDPA